MKKSAAFIMLLSIFSLVPLGAQGQTPAPKTTSPTTLSKEVAPLTLEEKKEKAYTELTLLHTRLLDISRRLESAAVELSGNDINIESVTPYLEDAKIALTDALSGLKLIGPTPKTPEDIVAQKTTLESGALETDSASLSQTTPVLSPEESLKETVATIETQLKSARENLIRSIVEFKTILLTVKETPKS